MQTATRRKNPLGDHPPTPKSTRSGCKVGWNVYDTIEDAELCSRWAQEEAQIKSDMGYDFGYQVPGSVRATSDGFEVVIP